jgi:phosphonate transport system permease protein
MTVSDTKAAVRPKRRDSAAQFEEEYAAFRRQKAIYNALFWAGFIACVIAATITAKFDVFRLIQGLPRTTEFLVKMVPPIQLSTFAADVGEWYWDINKWLNSLLNTLLMAYLATVLGTIIGGALSFFAARNLAPNYLTYWTIRRVLEIARTVPDIVWALLFVMAFGIGPLAGVLAISVHTIGAQGKLFAEVNENTSLLPLDGIRAAGGNWFHEIRFGIIPQAMPNYMSYSFWRIELNVRSATIVGFVGAGGIGHDLFTSIQLLYFSDAGAILLIVVATVMIIDMLSEKFRHSAIGKASFSH